MALTKTNFINYIRCPRYVGLDKIKKNKLSDDISYLEYIKEEEQEMALDILACMFDEDGEDIIDVKNEQLEIMMPYYKKIETLTADKISNLFGGKTNSAISTFNQESYDFNRNGIKYLCYVDIENIDNNNTNIIEVKATTSKKYLEMEFSESRKDEKLSIFYQDDKKIYHLLDDLSSFNEFSSKLKQEYEKKKNKLFDKYDACGKYVYDLAVQRFIIEGDLKSNGGDIDNYKFYLAVLNHEYIYDGKVDNDNNPIYSDDIINIFDFTALTKEYMKIIEEDSLKIEEYINNININECNIGVFCERKKPTKCKFLPVCYARLPRKNSIFTYFFNHVGFKDEALVTHYPFDLINEGKVHMLDIPSTWITRKNNEIQRNAVEFKTPYINKEKINDAIDLIKYPIYHLDFETFPCPLPRFRGEKCYTQSPFQFSLHIEKKAGVCDKDYDYVEFLAEDLKDRREELVKALIDNIDMSNGGTLFAQNVGFEKARIKELAISFPKYKNELLKIIRNPFDLMYLLKGNKELFLSLGYNESEASLINYYHEDLDGSYSIKKTLPLFSKLSYKDLDIQNGTEALVSYAKFDSLSNDEKEKIMSDLKEYCKQDTWAMVEILQSLRKVVSEKVGN